MFFFFFNDTATTEIYTLSLHDALPISPQAERGQQARLHPPLHRRLRARAEAPLRLPDGPLARHRPGGDRKSTRLNSSHANISYAVFCLKKKNNSISYIYTLNHCRTFSP